METFEKKEIEKLTSKKSIPAFRSGDTLKITVKIKEGDKSRSQVFEGMCIARKNNSLNSNFTVRKISHGEGVERVFPLFSPIIEKIEVITPKVIRLITQTVNDTADEDGWAFLGDVGGLIQKKQPNFDSRIYGFEKLTPLIKSTGKFEIDQRESHKGRAKLIYIRRKK